jgi:hypothetical protein
MYVPLVLKWWWAIVVGIILSVIGAYLSSQFGSGRFIPFWGWPVISVLGIVVAQFLVFHELRKERDYLAERVRELEHTGDRSALKGDVRVIVAPNEGNENLTASVTFTTEGKRGQWSNLRGHPSALRFVTLGGTIVRDIDLPAEIPCGNGKLVIKRFSDNGFYWDEEGTIGDRVRVEFYLS